MECVVGGGNGGRRDYGKYIFCWDADNHKIKITPKYPDMNSSTPMFGLGNATFKFNINHLPEKIVVSITDESTGEGLLPTSPFRLKRWRVFSTGGSEITRVLTGYNGWQKSISFLQTDDFILKECSDGTIKKNGYSINSGTYGRVEQ